LDDLPKTLDCFFDSQEYLTPGTLKNWDALVEKAKSYEKVQIIQESLSGGAIRIYLDTMKTLISHSDENYKNFFTDKQLTNKTFFLRHNLVDISKAPLLAKTPRAIAHDDNYKLINFATTLPKSKTQQKQLTTTTITHTVSEESKSKEQPQHTGTFDDFYTVYNDIEMRYLDETIVMDDAKMEIKDLCEVYKHILQEKSWEREGMESFDDEWRGEILPIIEPYFGK